MNSLLKNTVIIEHPLIAHKVTHLRDVYTGSKEFCELVNEITMLMGYEALRDLNLKNVTVTAPLRTFDSPVLAEDFTIVPILRAGLGMVDGLRSLSYLYYVLFVAKSAVSYLFAYKASIVRADQKSYIINRLDIFVNLARVLIQIVVMVVFKKYLLYLLLEVAAVVAHNLVVSRVADKN